jgi:dienelactone hydrolase
MSRSLASFTLVAFVAIAGLFVLQVPQADAAVSQLPSIVKPKPVPPVAAPISADPAGGRARGTVIMVHKGGWAGHDGVRQDRLMQSPGKLFLERGWRVVSIDYEEGSEGLQDVLNAAGGELARGTGDGPLCIYGESAGAQLALVAASRLRAIDCVIGVGAPADLAFYQEQGSASENGQVRFVANRISRFFGTTRDQIASWNPTSLAPTLHADVLLVHEADDTLVPPVHDRRFQAARPTTQLLVLEPGDPSDRATDFVHGSVSQLGRARFESALGAFADRAVADRATERNATRTGCSRVNRSLDEIGLRGLQAGLRCLARKDATSLRARTGGWGQTSVKLRGEVNAARVWGHLRTTRSGRRALAATVKRRAKVTVQTGHPSRVTLRATRSR